MSERWYRHEHEREGWTRYYFLYGGPGQVRKVRRIDCSHCGLMDCIETVYVALVVVVNLATWRRSYDPRYYEPAFRLGYPWWFDSTERA